MSNERNLKEAKKIRESIKEMEKNPKTYSSIKYLKKEADRLERTEDWEEGDVQVMRYAELGIHSLELFRMRVIDKIGEITSAGQKVLDRLVALEEKVAAIEDKKVLEETVPTEKSFYDYVRFMCGNKEFRQEYKETETAAEAFEVIWHFDNRHGNVIRDFAIGVETYDNGWNIPKDGDFYGLLACVNQMLVELGYDEFEEKYNE